MPPARSCRAKTKIASGFFWSAIPAFRSARQPMPGRRRRHRPRRRVLRNSSWRLRSRPGRTAFSQPLFPGSAESARGPLQSRHVSLSVCPQQRGYSMKRALLTAAAVAAAVMFAPALCVADDARQDFTLINDTGYTISEVYVSPVQADDWQEDVMGEDTLEDGQRVNIHFQRDETTCRWDLKVVYADDNSSAEWGNVNLCSVSEITIHYDRDKDKTWATYQ